MDTNVTVGVNGEPVAGFNTTVDCAVKPAPVIVNVCGVPEPVIGDGATLAIDGVAIAGTIDNPA